MMGLTPMQAKCLEAIKRLTDHDVPPSYEQIGVALGLASKSNVHRLVHGLKERGFVEFEPGRQRTLRIRGFDATGLERHTSDHLRALRARCDEILKGRAQ